MLEHFTKKNYKKKKINEKELRVEKIIKKKYEKLYVKLKKKKKLFNSWRNVKLSA